MGRVPATYAAGAIGCPPDHDPVRGGKAIADYDEELRDVLGEFEGRTETLRATASGTVVSLVSQFSPRWGRARVSGHELDERQADGSPKAGVDMVACRDPKM